MAIKKKIENIGIITSGGDCGGLNAVIKGAAQTARFYGQNLFAITNGYAGLYNLIDFSKLVCLDEKECDAISTHLAGSTIGNSRIKISQIKDKDKYTRIKEGLKKFQIDALIIAGGDDSGSVVLDLEEQGIPCIHVPKTMDLDLQPYSVGGDSTIARIARYGQDLKTTANTHNRIVILEVFGRYAGHSAFRGGIAAGADVILIPEIKVDFDATYEHIFSIFKERIERSHLHKSEVLLVVAEGIRNNAGDLLVDDKNLDAFGHATLGGAGEYISDALKKRLKADSRVTHLMKSTYQYVKGMHEQIEIRTLKPTHLVRCGESSAFDISFGLQVGAAAIELLRQDLSGITVLNYREGTIHYMPIKQAIQQFFVHLDDVAAYERMGIFFGREKPNYKAPLISKATKNVYRPY